MSKNKALSTSEPVSIEQAWGRGDELGMVAAVVRKYARVLDMTDAGRDIKPLATGLFEAVDRYHAMELAQGKTDTPLSAILAEAETIIANA